MYGVYKSKYPLLIKNTSFEVTACDCQLTVKHILFECVDFIESRNRHFSVNSSRELFEKVPPDSILSYLHEIGLFYRL